MNFISAHVHRFHTVFTRPQAGSFVRTALLILLAAASSQAQDGVVRFRQSAVTVSEGIGVVVVELERTGTAAGTQISFQTIAQSAVAGVDFHPVAESYTFAGGETSVPLAIQVFDNAQAQADRQFKLILADPVDLVIGTPAELQITVADNDETLAPGRGAAGTNVFQGIYALGTNSAGAILAGGNFRTFNGTPRNHLARILPAGALDAAFDAGSGPDDQVWAIAVQPNDHILVGGEFRNVNGQSRSGVARLTPTGEVDPNFDPGTGTDALVESIEVQDNGQILIAGRFGTFDGVPRTDVALLHADGSLDETFNAVTPASFFGDTARRHGDHILVGGFVAGPGANVQNALMRFNLAGVRDASFQVSVGDIFFNQVYDLVVQSDLKIVLCGSFLGVNGAPSSGVARLNANGTLDTGFNVGTGADDTVIRIKRQADGRLLVAGVFRHFNGVPRSGIARLESNGSVDLTFDPGAGANDYAYQALPLADGGTLVGGAFSQFDGYDRFRLAELGANGKLRTQPVRILEAVLAPGPNLQLQLAVEPGRDFRLLTSSTLSSWSPVFTNRTARQRFEVIQPAVAAGQFFQVEQAFATP